MDKLPFDFGIRLKELRVKRNLTQKEVADKLGVSKNTISKYENNTGTPSLERFVHLAILYNTSLDYIVNIPDRESIYIDNLSLKSQTILKDIIEVLKNNEND